MENIDEIKKDKNLTWIESEQIIFAWLDKDNQVTPLTDEQLNPVWKILNYETGKYESEFISAGQIDPDGNVELVFTHASDYTIVVDAKIMSDNGQADNKSDETIPAPKTDDSTSKYTWNNAIIIIIGICIMLIVIGAIFYVRKKSGSEE